MLQINDTVISLDIVEEMFFCDLNHCKGICCVEGEAGAPLEKDELPQIEQSLPFVWEDLSDSAKKIIKQSGFACLDYDDEYVTAIVDGKDCVFTCYDDNGICRCALEKAYNEGKITFNKPVSCHLYPIRVSCYQRFRAVNYHRWSVCKSAIALGELKQVRVYQFLKDPLIRKFGKAWYDQLHYFAEYHLAKR
ncbi:MAG: DUF3109 family protein [Dysgonamonadaceae bacterium]|jgi:hypothetical protein|nr:DUF3109 family protein [Dysgonamonadaceae bacterium]